MDMNEVWTKSAMEQFGFTQEQADQWLCVWAAEHHGGETTLSYIDWLKHRIVDARERLAMAANDLINALENSRSVALETGQAILHLSRILSLVEPNLAAEREQTKKEKRG